MRLTKPSDGPVSALINRRVSLMISAPLARAGVSPNGATLVSGLIAAGSAVSYVFQLWWLGGLLLQLSSIFGGVDGEIARRTGQTSRYGDFLDTTVDRAVEYGAIAAIAVGLSDAWGVWAWGLALTTLGGTFVLASASEKYRSVMGRNYPKREIEGPLSLYRVRTRRASVRGSGGVRARHHRRRYTVLDACRARGRNAPDLPVQDRGAQGRHESSGLTVPPSPLSTRPARHLQSPSVRWRPPGRGHLAHPQIPSAPTCIQVGA